MEYKVWSKEYEKELQLLRDKIKKLKEEKKLIKSVEKRLEEERRLYILQGMYMQCRDTYEILSIRAVKELGKVQQALA